MPLPYDIKDVIEEQIPFSQTMNLRKRHIGPSCELFFRSDPIKIIRGQGQYLYNVVRAGQNQMAILNTNSRFLHDNLVLYAKKLTSKFPEKLEIVFFVNSGSEANDLALRLSKSHTQSEEVIALEHAYHGNVRSLIEISPYKFAKGYTPPSTVHIVPVPDTYRGKYRNDKYTEEECANHYANEIKTVIDSLENEGKKLGCFIAESLQSCGGQVIYPQGYLRKVYDHVHENGGVVIADEVQVGFGRVGSSWWAFETQGSDLVPDIVTLGKPMGNGHPVAAVVTTKEIADSFCSREKEYFNTFGGNPVSCAISNAVLDVIEKENLMKKAQENGDHLITEFKKLSQKYDIIGDVRGWGMFVGVDLVKDRTTREAHTSPAKFMPPLAFTKENCDRLIQTMDRIFEEMLEINFED
ncbi:AGXT2L1 [Lepeophtheirus salmonis]|uniref:AGXT2L1 n=1 Tax=Lepeophtheirus salmonis TaxID=72036 RepID=A0A7R8CPM3_LEPSM|nr:AGXT2L1 [Lepeophtheirus salmonis]CAF2852983.1 AGXT2L1 [Lepeophtheirus salmonis]